MTKFKKYLATTIINIIYLGVLTFNQDPFKENYSMMTSSFLGYFIVMGLCVLLSFNFFIAYKTIESKLLPLSIGPIVGCLFPYFDGKGDIVSNLHVIGAYIAFISVCMGTILNILKFRNFNYKKGTLLIRIFVVVFIVTCYIYLQSMGVTSIQQLILLSTCLIINCYIVYQIK